MVKTVILTGTEEVVSELGYTNTLVINASSSPVYASNRPGVIAYSDGVIEVPAGTRDTITDTNGTVYLLGNGRVELRGVDYINFKVPSSSNGDGGGSRPTVETMPTIDGIFGYFSAENIDGNKWQNLLLQANYISLSGVSIEDGAAHFNGSTGFGTYPCNPPTTIYLALKTAGIAADAYFGNTILTISRYFKIMSLVQSYGGGFAFSNTVNADIYKNPAVKPSTQYQVVATTVNEGQISVFIDGEKIGVTSMQSLSGSTAISFANHLPSSVDGDGDYFMKFCAFGDEPHTEEQIAQNSNWLIEKYFD